MINDNYELELTLEEKSLLLAYPMASQDDKTVVDTVLKKYKQDKDYSCLFSSPYILNFEDNQVLNINKSTNQMQDFYI